GIKPLITARVVMAVSSVIFWLGCRAVFRSFRLPSAMCALGSWLAGLAAIGWSVRFITPDLLASGLICLATGQMVQARQVANWFSAAFSGLLWGLAYLTKPIALPLALAVGLGFLLIENHSTANELRQRIKTFFLTLSVLALVASPWVLVLSLKYRTLTISTTARIAHAVAGPPDANRQHPTVTQFHRPEPGRITSWEDPSSLPYQYWSPFANRAYAMHQLDR